MTMSSSSDEAYSSGGRGRRRVATKSSLPYRENQMAYHPAKKCYCEKKAPRWISWSDDNLGRRDGCGYCLWHADPCSPFMRQLLIDLDAMRRIEDELDEGRQPWQRNVADAAPRQQLEVMRKRVGATTPLIDKVDEKNAKIQALRARCEGFVRIALFKSVFHGLMMFLLGVVAANVLGY